VAPSDREQLYDLMVRYGRANDTHDAELVRTCFTDDVVARYDPFTGPVPLQGWDEFIASWLGGLEHIDCAHQFTNFTYDLDGDEGSFSCLLSAQHWPRGAELSDDRPNYTVGARYDNRVRRTPDGWRITSLHLTTLWLAGDSSVFDHIHAGASRPGGR
jgi:SnoaL-like protein